MLKQNILPSRQGELFRVNLLQNNDDGPYLKKDIMQSNKRSMALLTGKGILQNITHFNNSLVMLQSKTKQISSLYPQNVQNINKTYVHCQSQLKILLSDSAKLRRQQIMLKGELEQIFQRQKINQQQLYQQCMPLLKGLFKVVKDSRNRQKDEYHLMDRTLVEIQLTKKVIVEGLIECERRIMNLQSIIGYQTSGKDEDTQ